MLLCCLLAGRSTEPRTLHSDPEITFDNVIDEIYTHVQHLGAQHCPPTPRHQWLIPYRLP